MKPRHFALIFALLFRISTSSADTVLGGIVDYLPSCYQHPMAYLFVEYNSGACRGNDPSTCPCENVHTDRRPSNNALLDEDNGMCVWAIAVDEYSYTSKPALSSLSTDNPAQTRFYSGYYNKNAANSPVVQAIDIQNQTTHIAISLLKGLKMVRFRYLTIGQRQHWYQGVQLRFTDDFVKRLVERDGSEAKFFSDLGMVCNDRNLLIDLECFYLTAIIPYDRREDGHHMIDCVKLAELPRGSYNFTKIPYKDTVTNIGDLSNCEQGTNLKDVAKVNPRSLKEVLMETLKNLAMAAASFVPVIGPILAIGIDLAYSIVVQYSNDAAGLDAVLKQGGVTSASVTGAVILEKLKDALLTKVKTLKLK